MRVAAIVAAVLVMVAVATSAATPAPRMKRNLAIVARDTGRPLSGVPRVWRPDKKWADSSVNAIVDDGHGGWFVGGSWSRIGSVDCPNVAHVLANRHVDRGFCPRPDDEVFALARVGSRLYVGGVFTRVGGTRRSYLAAVDVRTGTPTKWDPGLDVLEPRYDAGNRVEPGVAIILKRRSNLYVRGEFDRASGKRRLGLARFDSRTGSLTRWVANGDFRYPPTGYLAPIAVDDRHVYIGDNDLPAIDTRTGAVTRRPDFVAGDADVDALAVQGRMLYVAAGPPYNKRIISLATDSGRVRRSRFWVDGPVAVLAPAGPTLLVGGSFDLVAGLRRRSLAALDMAHNRVLPWKPVGPAASFGGQITSIAATQKQVAIGCTACE
jgi:trimeric autotransporter adhesin